MQSRREFLRALGIAAAGAIANPLGAEPAKAGRRAARKSPNVILVITDDQGYGDLGCHGNEIIRTPNLDALYTQSVRLTDFHVGPTCAPTRAGLMTGHYCNRTGVWHTIMGRSLLRRDEVTMADVFGAGGYRTGIFGKWHLGDNFPFRPQHRGFHEVLIHGGGGVGQTPDFWGNDYFDDTYWHNGTPEKHTGYCTDIWFDGALRFIEANRNRPFFAYLTTNAPHGPYNVAEKYSDLYKDKDVPNANFYGMITNIDENMGRLLGKLKSLGLEENTILVFMTDNGTAAGFRGGKGFNSGMRGTKGSEYEGGHRVPCFVRWPAGGLGGGRNVNRLTAHIDLLPTLIDLCDLQGPSGVTFDGTSITPLLKGDDANWPDRILVTDSQRIEHPEKWRKSAVMTDRWRLVNGKELYDLPRDPGQTSDVAAEYPDVVRKLRQAYEKWWESVSQRFDECCEIVLGSDEENPTRLTCHDWHGGGAVPWAQGHIRNGLKANGFWAVDVARAGEYEFSLRRWPMEIDAPINAAIPKGKAIRAQQARLQIADVDVSKPIEAQAKKVTFKVSLPAGKTTLRTWFTADDGTSRGAYFAYVKRVS
ncbi:MAG: arylsulfatase [Sedimentisphaerales bacterium]|nr:arylsulfatase [Sedimentisphaerales bacterium]